jgi:hypothetical protein
LEKHFNFIDREKKHTHTHTRIFLFFFNQHSSSSYLGQLGCTATVEVGITRIARENHFLVGEVTVEVGTVVKAGVAGFTQSELVLAGFLCTFFGSQLEVVRGIVAVVVVVLVGGSRSNRKSSSSPVFCSSSSSSRHFSSVVFFFQETIIRHKEEKVFQFYSNDTDVVSNNIKVKNYKHTKT